MKPYYSEGGIEIYHGDCRTVLGQLPANSVHCVVTSPPYWGLRDYGVDGQLGLEPTPDEYVQHMVEVFREVRRVLREDGTCWLNLGDSFAAHYSGNNGYHDGRVNRDKRMGPGIPEGLKPKDLVGIPWRVAFALQADGWWLRSDIIWHKPNPMPESVTDRPTKAHEYVFLLSKSARYYYDAEAVREKVGEPVRMAASFRDGGVYTNNRSFDNDGGIEKATHGDGEPNLSGRNRRTVWTIATQPYKMAHFATFPEALVEPCILAGTSERGCCPECGKPWERVVEKCPEDKPTTRGQQNWTAVTGQRDSAGGLPQRECITLGWRPTCQCGAFDGAPEYVHEPEPCTVLDPFSGSGTTGRVAVRHRRRYIGIELKAEYIELDRADNTQVVLPLGV